MFEIFGIEFYQIISFLRQLGLALAGAASLWGIVFLYIAEKKERTEIGKIITSWVGMRLRWLVFGGSILAIFSWMILLSLTPSLAHEGVTLITDFDEILAAAYAMTPIYILLAIVLLAGISRRGLSDNKKGMTWFYGAVLILTSIAISYYTDLRGLSLDAKIFHPFHGFHSIFTLGTVLTLDFIFLSTKNAPLVQKHVFPYFPQISKVIWVGLSLDLLSTLLIYPEAIILSSRFFFAQAVVGILIINGILLSGVLTRRILKHIEQGEFETSRKWEFFATIAGAVSVTSWVSITFVDFLHGVELSLPILFSIYIAVIIFGIISHTIWNKLDTTSERMVHIK